MTLPASVSAPDQPEVVQHLAHMIELHEATISRQAAALAERDATIQELYRQMAELRRERDSILDAGTNLRLVVKHQDEKLDELRDQLRLAEAKLAHGGGL